MHRPVALSLMLFLAACGGDRTRTQRDPPDSGTRCGDGLIDEGEECDGSDLGEASCQSLGFDTGTLLCSEACRLVSSQCVRRCGNGQLDLGETCDGELGPLACANFGRRSCTSTCEIDESTCITEPYATGPTLDVTSGTNAALTDLPPAGAGELVVAVSVPPRLSIYRYVQGMGFPDAQRRVLNTDVSVPLSPLAAELTGDGAIDLAAVKEDGSVSLFVAAGETFTERPAIPANAACDAARFLGVLGPAAAPRVILAGCPVTGFQFDAILVLEASEPMPSHVTIPSSEAVSLAIGDMDLDGTVDLVYATDGSGDLQVLLQTATGFEPSDSIPVEGPVLDLKLADLDQDGDADLVIATASGIKTYERTPTGFADRRDLTGAVSLLQVVDLDGDGRLDLVWVDTTSDRIELRRNGGDFTFTSYFLATTATGARNLLAGDVDGDGDVDLILTRMASASLFRAAVFLNRVR